MESLPLETLGCILSYCGLRTLITLRRVSKQFRALSDGVPKKWINLTDLFKSDVVDLSARIAIAVHFAGAGLVGFSGFTENYNLCKDHLRGLPLLLSVNCPNLMTLRLPESQSYSYILHDLCKCAASLPKLEEITAVHIPGRLVVALPALRRINGIVDGRVNKAVDVEALARKLSGCQHIAGIESGLFFKIAKHFCEKEVTLCPEIRGGFGCELQHLHRYEYIARCQDSRWVDCVNRMFPEMWFSNVRTSSEDFAQSLFPIAHRIKSMQLFVGQRQRWTFEETPIAFSNMVCLRRLRIAGYLAEEYRDYFSFLPKLEQLEHLALMMNDMRTGWSYLIAMLAPSAPLRKLNIRCKSLPDDFLAHFKALAASGAQLSYLKVSQRSPLTISVLRPILEVMPCIEKLIVSSCADDIFKFVPRILANLTYLEVSPVCLVQILDLAEERINAGKVLPKLTVWVYDVPSVDSTERERLQLAGIDLTQTNYFPDTD